VADTTLLVSQISQPLLNDLVFGSIQSFRIVPNYLTKHEFQERLQTVEARAKSLLSGGANLFR